MSLLFDRYHSIHSTLKKYAGEMDRLNNEANALEQELADENSELEAWYNTQLQQHTAKEMRATALIGIAKAHSSKLVESRYSLPYDTGITSRLAVQINSGSRNDPFAAKLYTEATGQLITVKQDIDFCVPST